MSGRRTGARAGGGSLYGDVHCIMGNGNMGCPLNRQTHTTENINLLQLCCRLVKKITAVDYI